MSTTFSAEEQGILDAVEPENKEAFSRFVNSGKSTPEYDKHLNVCPRCLAAVNLMVKKMTEALYAVGDILRKSEGDLGK
jgi:hypothetical protein